MTRARPRALVLPLAALAAAVAVFALRAQQAQPALAERPAAQRPPLLLLTALPLMFGEGFAIDSGSPALDALTKRYRIVPISVSDAAELKKGRMLLMAQPRAQRPEDLVALDGWVRSGGRLVLLADPMLEWPSERPLGDPLRPPPMFVDTGLLGHWGLRLDAPDQRGGAQRRLGGRAVLTRSPGRLIGNCAIGGDGLVAHCRIGRGTATVIADADFLDTDALGPGRDNLDALLAELAEAER